MFKYLSIIALLLCLRISYAEQSDKPQSIQAGLGLVVGNSVYKGDSSRVFVVPMVKYRFEKFFLNATTVGYELYQEQGFCVNAIAKWRFDGYRQSDSSFLTGMDKRKMTLDGGLELSYKDGWGKSSLLITNDLFGHHKGQEAVLSYSKMFMMGDFSLTPAIGCSYKSSNLCDYYYGVKNSEQTPSRAAYKANDTFNGFVSMNLGYKINDNWSAITILGYEWLGSEITKSPIVDSHHQTTVITGLMYSF